ncbi:MAG: hypothetical protein KR126chlam1_00943 [Chlamydiae bacterium]|nr:hypothetical protein [Chlamydiota bacterium]
MNFTREPIIETIVTPKSGYKLIIRNSKGQGQEEYVVDAIEVVSFGHSFFFRSMERPKSFLVPVSDYEVVESKETRVVLKNASFERSIKIGGGREASMKASREGAEDQDPAAVEQRLEKKRERKRHRRKRVVSTEEKEPQTEKAEPKAQKEPSEGGGAKDETKVSPPPVRALIPPPSQLISEKFSKEREETPPVSEGDVVPESVEKEEKPKRTRRRKKAEPKTPEDETPAIAAEEAPPKEEASPPESEGGEMQRISEEIPEPVTSTSFSSVEESSLIPPFGKTW